MIVEHFVPISLAIALFFFLLHERMIKKMAAQPDEPVKPPPRNGLVDKNGKLQALMPRGCKAVANCSRCKHQHVFSPQGFVEQILVNGKLMCESCGEDTLHNWHSVDVMLEKLAKILRQRATPQRDPPRAA